MSKVPKIMGRGEGFEPSATGATVRCSTTELTPPHRIPDYSKVMAGVTPGLFAPAVANIPARPVGASTDPALRLIA